MSEAQGINTSSVVFVFPEYTTFNFFTSYDLGTSTKQLMIQLKKLNKVVCKHGIYKIFKKNTQY